MSNSLAEIAAREDGAVHSLVWMAQDAELVLPPIPELYLDRLIEIAPMTCFATDPDLVSSLGRMKLSAQLGQGRWPKTGLALRLFPQGRWLYWQYILVGRVSLIQINMRFLLTAPTRVGSLAAASLAHERLARHLSDEVILSRYLSDGPRRPEETAYLVTLANPEGGRPEEQHHIWSAEQGLKQVPEYHPIFNGRQAIAKTAEEVIFRP